MRPPRASVVASVVESCLVVELSRPLAGLSSGGLLAGWRSWWSCGCVAHLAVEVGEGDPGWWVPDGLSGGGVDRYGPGRRVEEGVVVSADHDKIVEVGGSAVGPVGDVVGVAG